MNRQALVGAFVLGGIALAMAAFVLFGNFHPFTRTEKAVLVFHGGSSGLSVGAPVTFRGVEVGSVDRIEIEYDPATKNAYVPVYVTIKPDTIALSGKDGRRSPSVRELVAHGLSGEINLRSFVTGTSEIDLDFAPGTPVEPHPELGSVTEIPTKQSTLQALTSEVQNLPLRQIGDNADAALLSIRQLSARLDTDLPPLVNSVRETSDHTREMIDSVHDLVQQLQPMLARTLNSVNRLADTGTDQLSARGQELHTVLQDSDAMVRKAGQGLANIESMTSARSVDRANLEASLRDIAAAASALRGFAADVERNPQLLLTGRRQ